MCTLRYYVNAGKQTVRDFSWVTKIQQQHRTNLVISETIRKSLNVLVFGSGLCTKCSYQQKQTCFCREESLHNEVSQPHAILYKNSGAPSGGPTFSNSVSSRQLYHWPVVGWREPVISALSSHPTTNQTLCC